MRGLKSIHVHIWMPGGHYYFWDALTTHVLLQHCSAVIMGAVASQITNPIIVYSTVYSGSDQRRHQSPASLAFVREIHRWPVNSRHKWLVTRKMKNVFIWWYYYDNEIVFGTNILEKSSETHVWYMSKHRPGSDINRLISRQFWIPCNQTMFMTRGNRKMLLINCNHIVSALIWLAR